MEDPASRRSYVLLGAGLFAMALLLGWWGDQAALESDGAQVGVHVVSADGSPLFRAERLELGPEAATVLGALLEAGRIGNFSVEWNAGPQAFVTSIDGVQNAGACGWIWSLNGVAGDRAANLQGVRTGDYVVWSWGCED